MGHLKTVPSECAVSFLLPLFSTSPLVRFTNCSNTINLTDFYYYLYFADYIIVSLTVLESSPFSGIEAPLIWLWWDELGETLELRSPVLGDAEEDIRPKRPRMVQSTAHKQQPLRGRPEVHSFSFQPVFACTEFASCRETPSRHSACRMPGAGGTQEGIQHLTSGCSVGSTHRRWSG